MPWSGSTGGAASEVQPGNRGGTVAQPGPSDWAGRPPVYRGATRNAGRRVALSRQAPFFSGRVDLRYGTRCRMLAAMGPGSLREVPPLSQSNQISRFPGSG
jgi:hypothetical protein